MKTNAQTTYILLERGVEDKALLQEINMVFADLGIPSVKKIIARYPTLYDLKKELHSEVNHHE